MRLSVVRPKLVSKKCTSGRRISINSTEAIFTELLSPKIVCGYYARVLNFLSAGKKKTACRDRFFNKNLPAEDAGYLILGLIIS
jgi:hypothetical protein